MTENSGKAPSYPFKWVPETDPDTLKFREQVFEDYSSERDVVVSQPGGMVVPKKFAAIAERLYNMEVRPDDVWIITYPKCGTTWTQEIVWNIVYDMNESLGQLPLMFRAPFPDYQCLETTKSLGLAIELLQANPDDPGHKASYRLKSDSFGMAEEAKSPRVIRTHMPLQFLPPSLLETAKVIFVCRNPKDSCVSYHYLLKTFPNKYAYKGEFKDTCKLFMDGTIGFGSYWYHLKSHWGFRNHPNFKLLRYEDMKKDLPSILRDLGNFLGKPLSDDQVAKLQNKVSLEGMREGNFFGVKNEVAKAQAKQFFRKGIIGDWKNHDLDEAKWDKWIEENLAGTDIKLAFS